VNNVETSIDNLRRELIANLELPPHVKINLHERDEIFEKHLAELLAFSQLKATKNELGATQQLSAAVDAQTPISKEQAATGAYLVRLTYALVIVAIGTLISSVATIALLHP
jgi:hypothetical protein